MPAGLAGPRNRGSRSSVPKPARAFCDMIRLPEQRQGFAIDEARNVRRTGFASPSCSNPVVEDIVDEVGSEATSRSKSLIIASRVRLRFSAAASNCVLASGVKRSDMAAAARERRGRIFVPADAHCWGRADNGILGDALGIQQGQGETQASYSLPRPA